MMKIRPALSAALLALLLCACGKAKEPPRIVNYTLPDVNAFNEAYTAEKETQPAEAAAAEAEEYRWNPHGNFTLNVVGDGGDYAAGFVNISMVDLSSHTAVLTYSIKDSRGYNLALAEGKAPEEKNYFFDSDGELVTGADEKEDEDGTRHVIIYLPDDHWLEFIGKEKLSSALYHYDGNYYGIKREG